MKLCWQLRVRRQQPSESTLASELDKVQILGLHGQYSLMDHLVASAREIVQRAIASDRREVEKHSHAPCHALSLATLLLCHRDRLGQLPEAEKTGVVLAGIHCLRPQPETGGENCEC